MNWLDDIKGRTFDDGFSSNVGAKSKNTNEDLNYRLIQNLKNTRLSENEQDNQSNQKHYGYNDSSNINMNENISGFEVLNEPQVYSLMVIDTTENKTKKIIITILIIAISIFLIYAIFSSNKENIETSFSNFFLSNNEEEKKLKNGNLNEALINPDLKLTQNEEENLNTLIPEKILEPNSVVGSIYASNQKEVYLTFDDGPSKSVTEPLLDLLKEEDIKATFFVLGQNIAGNEEVLKRTYDEGHYIANHGYSHKYEEIYASKEAVYEDYLKAENEIKRVLGDSYNSYLYRFPGGSSGGPYHNVKQEAVTYLEENSIASLNWNVLTGDSEVPTGTSSVDGEIERFNETRKALATNGLVILQHDMFNKSNTVETTKRIINILRQEGYTFKNYYEVFKNEVENKNENEIIEEKESQFFEDDFTTENEENILD